MKHTPEICKQCGSQTRGLVYDRALLDDEDISRIRICNSCDSEFFIFDELKNTKDMRLVDDTFRKVSLRMGLESEQALMIAKRLFINMMKIR